MMVIIVGTFRILKKLNVVNLTFRSANLVRYGTKIRTKFMLVLRFYWLRNISYQYFYYFSWLVGWHFCLL